METLLRRPHSQLLVHGRPPPRHRVHTQREKVLRLGVGTRGAAVHNPHPQPDQPPGLRLPDTPRLPPRHRAGTHLPGRNLRRFPHPAERWRRTPQRLFSGLQLPHIGRQSFGRQCRDGQRHEPVEILPRTDGGLRSRGSRSAVLLQSREHAPRPAQLHRHGRLRHAARAALRRRLQIFGQRRPHSRARQRHLRAGAPL